MTSCWTETFQGKIGEYHQLLVNVAYRFTYDIECAKDIVQDSYIAVLQSTESFRGASSLKTYLYRIVINKSIDSQRRLKRWRNIVNVLTTALPVDNCISDNAEMHHLLGQIMDTVPRNLQMPLILAEVDGLSYTEIAEILTIPLNTVRTRIYRCREKIRKEFIKRRLAL